MVQHYIQAVEIFFFFFFLIKWASLDVPAGGLMTSRPGPGDGTGGGAIDTRPQDWPVSGDVTGVGPQEVTLQIGQAPHDVKAGWIVNMKNRG